MTMLAVWSFVKKYHAPIAWALLALAVVALVIGFAAHERKVGALGAELHTATVAGVVWQKKADSTDRVLKVQSDSADQWHAKYDAARAQVATRTVVHVDTVTRHDTTFVYDTTFVHDSVFVAAADTAVNSCTEARHTCSSDLAARDSVIKALRTQVKVLKKSQPSFLSTLGKTAAVVLVTALAAKVVK
jgi:hypothetical protein